MCLSVCVRVFVWVSVAVNSHACYRWIVNDITDCNSCLFSVSVCVILFWSCMCKVVCVRECLSFYFGLVCVRLSVYVCVFT